MSPTDSDILDAIKAQVSLKTLKNSLPGLDQDRLNDFYSKLSTLIPPPGATALLFVDGASDSEDNAGIGIQLLCNDIEIATVSRGIGKGTNNIAEYTAFIEGLKLALGNGFTKVTVNSDSELLVRQIDGQYKVKSPNIIPLHRKATSLLFKFDEYAVKHVRRELNGIADKLAKAGVKSG